VPQLPQATHCASCHWPVRWVETETGKRMPIDAAPNPLGRLVLVRHETSAGPVGPWYVHVLGRDEFHEGDRYISHFASCPHARTWRKP
jgi:hypothetical protein